MIAKLDDALGRGARAWVDAVQRKPTRVIALCAAATAALLTLALTSLGLNTNENDLFSDELRFVTLREEWNASFPSLVDPVIAVVDGTTADLTHSVSQELASLLRANPEHFSDVRLLGGDEFFERNGLLYLEIDELDDLLDNLLAVHPYLSSLSRDLTLRGFLSMLGDATDAKARDDLGDFDLTDVFTRVGDVIAAHREGISRRLSWADVITGRKSTRRDRRRFLLVQPVVNYANLEPAEVTLLGLRDAIDELGLDSRSGVTIRLTGVFPLSYEEMENMTAQSIWAGLASFVMVGVILVAGLGSGRLVLASLATLLVGLVWTAGLAALSVGRLNLISVAFAVLFIGLSIDFAIQI